MCKSLCTYRKYIAIDPITFEYNCTENPHIILSAKENGSNRFSQIFAAGGGGTNLNSTNFHPFYFDVYNSWVTQIENNQPVGFNAQINPLLPSITQTGDLLGDAPVGPPFNLPLNIVQTFNSFTITDTAIPGLALNYSKPPFDFADNIAADQYVAPYSYGGLSFSTGGDPVILVEFLDVNGSHCKGA